MIKGHLHDGVHVNVGRRRDGAGRIVGILRGRGHALGSSTIDGSNASRRIPPALPLPAEPEHLSHYPSRRGGYYLACFLKARDAAPTPSVSLQGGGASPREVRLLCGGKKSLGVNEGECRSCTGGKRNGRWCMVRIPVVLQFFIQFILEKATGFYARIMFILSNVMHYDQINNRIYGFTFD